MIMAKLVWRAFTFDEQRAGVEDGLTAVQISVMEDELMIDALLVGMLLLEDERG